jgi:hypothetical protein
MSPQAWRNRINKNSRIEYAKQGIQWMPFVQELWNPMMDRLTGKREKP